LEVTYTLQPQDFEQLQKFFARRNGGISSRWMFLFVPVAAICLFGLNMLIDPNRQRVLFQWRVNPWAMAGSTLLPFLLFAVFWFVFLRLNTAHQKAQWKTNPALTQPHTTRITPQHLYNRDASGENIAYWQGVHEVAADEHCLYFFTTKETAHVLPRRAFADAAQAEQFYRAALGYWNEARGANAQPPIPEPQST
jgi:hypothetical protein